MRSVGFVLSSVFALVACAESADDPGAQDDDLVMHQHHYVDVSADAPMTGVPRDKILRALVKIDRVAHTADNPVRRAIATETLARIEKGDVLLGSIEAARGIDRWHMCKDENEKACDGAMPAADDRTWTGDAALEKKLETDLDGYQWGNRIYFTLSSATDLDILAGTLIHETNHVSNRSECSYYRIIDQHVVDPDRAYVEEFRAFFAECIYNDHGDVAKCGEYADGRVADYDFHAKHDPPSELADRIAKEKAGRLVPEKSGWPASFDACPQR